MRRRTIGEFLSGYLKRLEGADDQRIRVDSDTSDDKGNVIVQPVLMLGKDTNDDIRPAKMDTEGRLDVVGVCPTHQAEVSLNQANPTSGTKYEVLDDTLVRLIAVAAKTTWTVQPTPLELHITVDGQTLRWFTANPASNVWFWVLWNYGDGSNDQAFVTPDYQKAIAFLLEGRDVKVEVEITGGTTSSVQCRLKWAKW